MICIYIMQTRSKTRKSMENGISSTTNAPKCLEIFIVIDTTGSMNNWIQAIRESIWACVNCVDLVTTAKWTIVKYEDYCDGQALLKYTQGSFDDIRQFIGELRAGGGGDAPEACKTALSQVLNLTDEKTDTKRLLFLLTDAPPHHACTGGGNYEREKGALGKRFDWIQLCRECAEKGIQVYSFINTSVFGTASFYAVLSQWTGGQLFHLTKYEKSDITRALMYVLNRLLDPEEDMEKPGHVNPMHFPNEGFRNMRDENPDRDSYLPSGRVRNQFSVYTINGNTLTHNTWSPPELGIRPVLGDMRNDAEYKRKVMRIFGELITEANVDTLVTMPLLGKLWRQLCCMQRFVPEIRELMDKFSCIKGRITNVAIRDELTAWVENSYDASEEIAEIIAKYPTTSTTTYYHIPPAKREHIHVKDLVEATKNCNGLTCRTIADMFREITVIDSAAHDTPISVANATGIGLQPSRFSNSLETGDSCQRTPVYDLPTSMSAADLFKCITRLFAEKPLLLSERPACIMALIAANSLNQHVAPIAGNYLMERQGRWLDWTDPTTFAPFFVRLCLTRATFFTHEELQRLRVLARLSWILWNKDNRIKATVWKSPFGLTVEECRKCRECGEQRSLSLMEDDRCALCICGTYNVGHLGNSKKAYMCACGTCGCIYARERIDQMEKQPMLRGTCKCHACHENVTSGQKKKAPTVRCDKCYMRYVRPTLEDRKFDAWLCPSCTAGTTQKDDETITVGEFIRENMETFLNETGMVERWVRMALDSNQSLFKLFAEFVDELSMNTMRLVRNEPRWFVRGQLVASMERDICEALAKGITITECCNVCFAEMKDAHLMRLCDIAATATCAGLVCNTCADSWVVLEAGHVVNPNRLCCMFCRRVVHPKVLKGMKKWSIGNFINEQVRALGRVPPDGTVGGWVAEMNARYYAQCKTCKQAKFFMEHVCGIRGDGVAVTDYECDECKNGSATDTEAFPCPNTSCGVRTYKSGGCNHMTCTQCGVHYCYVCREIVDEDEIYDHLREEHGSIY